MVLFAFGLNYTQTRFLFDVLHMHDGFRVSWTLDRNPLFLYLVTVASFATYAAQCMAAFRAMHSRIVLALQVYPDMVHAFMSMRGLPGAGRASDAIADPFRRRLP